MSGQKFNIEILPTGKTALGEGPHWDADKNQLYYVDITGKTVHRYDPKTQKEFKATVGKPGPDFDSASLIIPVASTPNKFILGYGSNLSLMTWDGKSSVPEKIEQLHSVEDKNPGGRFNDGKCDPSGRLWAGTMGPGKTLEELETKQGFLFSLDGKTGKLTEHLDQICVANGLAWSPDEKEFYYIDSLTYRVDTFDYDKATGALSNRRPAFDFKANNVEGLPDGMTIDSDGNLWIAVFAGKAIIHVNPKTGKLLNTVQMPTPNITSCCFGGENLDILYATSATFGMTPEQLAADPAAGSLFKITNTGAKGLSVGIPYAGNH